MTKAQNFPLDTPTRFYPFSTSRPCNYNVYQSDFYGLVDLGVESGPNIKLAPTEPNLSQKVQRCIESNFRSLGEQADVTQDFHVKLPKKV